MPFVENYYQQMLFILAPKSDYDPSIDPEENSNALQGLAKFTIGWEREEFNITKHISLRIDSSYLGILRVYGKKADNQTSLDTEEKFLTLDCPQNFGNDARLITKTWKCLDGHIIHAENVCDARPNCPDSSDELPTLCKGIPDPLDEGLSDFFIAILILGFISFVTYLILSSYGISYPKSTIEMDESDELPDVDHCDEIKESFVQMNKVFSTIDVDAEKSDVDMLNNRITQEGITSLKGTYRKYHDRGLAQQLVFYETVHDFSMHPAYKDSCSTLMDHIAIEKEDIHLKTLDRPKCTEQFLRKNLEIASFYFDVYDRNGFFSRLKRKILYIPEWIFGSKFPEITFYASIIITIGLAIKNVVTQYLDTIVDMKIYSSLQHVTENFVGDKEKFAQMSNLPLHEMSYAYLLFGLLSHIGYYIIYIMDFKCIFKTKNSKSQKILFGLSVFFPLHFVTLELARTMAQVIQMRYGLQIILPISTKNEGDIENAAENYVTYRREIKGKMNRIMTIRNTLMKMLIVETLIENLPQLMIIVTFMISELTSGSGKLLMIVKDGLVNYFGGNLIFLCLVIIFLHLNKFGFALLTIHGRMEYPFSNGMKGNLIILASVVIMIGGKIFLLTTALSHATPLYPIYIILELGIATIYCKATGIRLDLMETILPSAISPSFIYIGNNDDKPKSEKEKLKLYTIVKLHFLNLILAYVPMYALTQSVESLNAFQSSFSPIVHVIFTLTYLASIGLYLLIDLIFKKFGSPWRYLEEAPNEIEQQYKKETVEAPNENNAEEIIALQAIP